MFLSLESYHGAFFPVARTVLRTFLKPRRTCPGRSFGINTKSGTNVLSGQVACEERRIKEGMAVNESQRPRTRRSGCEVTAFASFEVRTEL